MTFGEYFKNRRMELGLTARKFATAKGYDVGYVSRLENDLIAPPAEESKVKALGEALEIDANSNEWREFLDLVAVARNELPNDLRNNEQITKILPAFYKSLRAAELNEKEIKKLIELIEKSGKE